MKVAIYVRVSTNDQNTGMQMNDLNEYVKTRGWEVFKVYEDVGISGAKSSRPSLNQLMDDARKRKFKAVLVWKFDRFARSLKHLVTALEEFNELGVGFVSYKENLDTASSMGRAMFGMIGVMAQLERDLIQERVASGMKAAKAKGVKLGRKVTVNDITKGRIKAMRVEGLSIHKIAEQLDIGVGSVQRVLKAG